MKVVRRTPGPAYANLQRRKPREGIRQTVRRALSKIECRPQFRFVAGGFSKNLGLEYVYNFGVMARVLLTGESRFLSPCDFKELRVIKRARFTTLTLAASQHSFCSIARPEGLKKTSTRSNCNCFDLLVKIITASQIVRISHSNPWRCQCSRVAPSGRSRRSSLSSYWHCRPPQSPTARAV